MYAGLPLAVALRRAGKQVFLANLTFTYLGETNVSYLAPHVAAVTAETTGADGYFPERRLAEWLAEQEQPSTVYAFEKVGVRPAPRRVRAPDRGAGGRRRSSSSTAAPTS